MTEPRDDEDLKRKDKKAKFTSRKNFQVIEYEEDEPEYEDEDEEFIIPAATNFEVFILNITLSCVSLIFHSNLRKIYLYSVVNTEARNYKILHRSPRALITSYNLCSRSF